MEDKDIDKCIEDFLTTEKVYHYTSFEAALNIIISNRLRFGKLSKMNDCNEVYRRLRYAEGVDLKSIEREYSMYKQLSFTRDKSLYAGYAVSAMWGHYAEKGYGVCLVFDKKELRYQLKRNMTRRNVVYRKIKDENIDVEEGDVRAFFEKHRKEIFFIKTKDWLYEQEWRILVRSEQEETYLPLGNSLMAIIMNFAPDIDCGDCVFNSTHAKIFKKVAPDIPLLSYGPWSGVLDISNGKANVWSKHKDEQEKWVPDF